MIRHDFPQGHLSRTCFLLLQLARYFLVSLSPSRSPLTPFLSVWFCCFLKCSQVPMSLVLQKINSVDDVETIAYKVNEILLKAG